MIDFTKLSNPKKDEIINPIAIFSSLPNKSKKYNGYLRDVQSEVLNQWFSLRNNRDNIIKMNTGSGKTTVSLLILQSCINEDKGNAVYVVPDTYLIQQVKDEAKDLGITIVDNPDDILFLRKKAILIISIQKLINGRTIFDERRTIDNIIIDDVHSCLDSAEQQFIVKIDRRQHSKLYKEIFGLFKKSLSSQNLLNTLNIEAGLETTNPMLVPYWDVKNFSSEIVTYINSHRTEQEYTSIFFPFEFLSDIVQYCNISISYNTIEISPDCLPIYKVSAFDNAKRRIFVSATLKDDGKLIRNFNLNSDLIKKVITPSQALDIGNRMILYPQALNTSITDDSLKVYLSNLSLNKRVIVIVPSHRRATYWKDVACHVFDKNNIDEIKNYTKGLDVVVNRYDGLDLKDELCSYLVIDGLPNSKSLFEQISESILRNTYKSTRDKIQQIEQGMGRGIRSNEDSCAVIIFGKKLLDIIYNGNSIDNFSLSTKVQYKLSEQISEQLYGESLENIMNVFNYCLEKNEDWLALVSKNLSEVEVDNSLNYNNDELQLNRAFSLAINSNYESAVKKIQEIVNKTSDEALKGYYMLYLAKYTNFINPVDSQRIMLKAKQLNPNLYLPIEGFDYIPRKEINVMQANSIINLINDKYRGNKQSYLYACESIISNLIFSSTEYKVFEENIDSLGKHLGFTCSRPDTEVGAGPDNLWYIGNDLYLVIECKNEAVSDFICKDDCGQLLTSVNWCKINCSETKKYVPIMIHKSNCFDSNAGPSEDIRIMTESNIQMISESVISFCKSLLKLNTLDEKEITRLLLENKLDDKSFISTYSSAYTIKINR